METRFQLITSIDERHQGEKCAVKTFLMAIKREYSEVNSGDYTFGPRLAFKRWGYDGVWTLPVTYSYRVNGAHTNNYAFNLVIFRYGS